MIAVGAAIDATYGETLGMQYTIRCPKCGGEAAFEEPFLFPRGDEAVAAEHAAGVTGFRANKDCFVIVRFPDEFPWRDPDNSHTRLRLGPSLPPQDIWGVCVCPRCVFRGKHRLDWPKDAFYAASFSFGTLWAICREHLVELRDYIASSDRRLKGYRWAWNLKHTPKEFLLVRRRERIVSVLDRLLSQPVRTAKKLHPAKNRSR